jgi:hypothetical protein
MTADMMTAILRSLARQRPFRPYFIELHSGERFQVRHPETILRRGDLFVHRSSDRTERVFDGAAVSQVIASPPGSPE